MVLDKMCIYWLMRFKLLCLTYVVYKILSQNHYQIMKKQVITVHVSHTKEVLTSEENERNALFIHNFCGIIEEDINDTQNTPDIIFWKVLTNKS